MYVRFVVSNLGIIRAASLLKEKFSLEDQEELKELFGWFNDFLAVPPPCEEALSWFKDCAKLHIRKAREMAFILEKNNIQVGMLTTDNPGIIVYEDKEQVAAKPF